MRKLKLEKLIICPITGYGAKIPSQDSLIPLLWYLPGVQSITYIIFPGKPELESASPHPLAWEDGFRAPSAEAWNCCCFLTCWLGAAESLAGCVLNQMPIIIMKDK